MHCAVLAVGKRFHVCVCACVILADMYRSGIGGVDRDPGRNELPMNRGFGETFGGMGKMDPSLHVCVPERARA